MGFSQADWQELQINLDRIRFGHRVQRPPPIRLSFLPQADAPKEPPRKTKPPEDPGYERFQLRLPL